jgi:septal ring factor EnvC (AmiA/AmiB activator)
MNKNICEFLKSDFSNELLFGDFLRTPLADEFVQAYRLFLGFDESNTISIEELKEQIEEYEEEIEDKDSKIDNLKEQIEDYKEQIETLKRQIKKQKSTIEDLEFDIEDYKEQKCS